MQRLPVLGQQFSGAGFGPGQQGGYFTIDEPLGAFGVARRGTGAGERRDRCRGVADRPDRLAEAELADHLGGQGGGGGQVVGGAGGGLAADQELGGPAAEPDGQGVSSPVFIDG